MKKWNKPQLLDLSYRYTEAGGLGGDPDGVMYQIRGRLLIGTSGLPINHPEIVRVSPP